MRAAAQQAEAGIAQAHAAEAVAEQMLAETLATRAGLEAAVRNAEAAVQLAELDLGQYVSAGTQLTSIVPERK